MQWSTDARAVTPVISNILMVAIAVILVMVLTVATAGMLGMIDEPAGQSTIETSQTDVGIAASILTSGTESPILVTRNGNRVGTMESSAGTTVTYLANKDDRLQFIALDEDGQREALLKSVTVDHRTSFAGQLSLDEVPLQDGSTSVAGTQKKVKVSGDVSKIQGKTGQAVQTLYRDTKTPAGIRIKDVPEYTSYTISFLIRSDGDTDDSDNAADNNYFETRLLGWENGHSIVAYGGTQNDQLVLGTDRGYNPFASVQTDESLPGSSDWHHVTITKRQGSQPEACVYSPTRGESCQTLSIYRSQGGESDFVIAESRFSGQFDEVNLFRNPISEGQIEDLRSGYYDQ